MSDNLNPLEGASPDTTDILYDTESQRRVAASQTYPLEVRLEAFEDIGAAIAFAAYLAGLRCLVYVPENYHTSRFGEIQTFGAEIIRVPTDYEGAVRLSQKRASSEELYDANPGGVNTPLQIRAYGEIAYEIYDELRDAPAAVAIPVSNKYHARRHISRIR